MADDHTTPDDTQQLSAPVPTARTRWLRTFVPWQMVRFAIINVRMLRLIWRGHHQERPAGPVTTRAPEIR